LLSRHARFPKEANISFMQIVDKNTINLRVYERGVGETLACGSAAAASVVAGIQLGLLENAVDVVFSTGKLHISWNGDPEPVFIRGPATSVFVGRFRL
jgi:diaminopimelate epimerase